jgi:hypothetical protein
MPGSDGDADRRARRNDPDDLLTAGMAAALAQLARGRRFAQNTGLSIWDFAVGIRHIDLQPNDLRWLVCKGYVEHAEETTRPRRKQRSFRPGGGLAFSERSCFVLTDVGLSLVRTCASGGLARHVCDPPVVVARADGAHRAASVIPHWDKSRRELWLGDQLVKRFRQPSPNQERILATLEEEGWRPLVQDPLPQDPDHRPKRRLSRTIHSLNTHHVKDLMRFQGDGTGEGVMWRRIASADS